jgi:RNA polymerase sigma-70 factor (ECF subfamily)
VTYSDLNERVRALLADGKRDAAVTLCLRELGPEVYGFLVAALRSQDDADEVFSAVSVRLWESFARFEGRCGVRAWLYMLARHELGDYRRGQRRHREGREPISELKDILEVARTESQSTPLSEQQRRLAKLRDGLSVDDRTLLILRVERNLPWEDIAMAFSGDVHRALSEVDVKRESARLRKRFQLLKDRLVELARL